MSGEPAARVDWRRSARDDHLYVREREWEAAHTVWIWPDRSPSMVFASALVVRDQARPRAGRRLRARRGAGRGRRARRHSGPDAPDREPQHHRAAWREAIVHDPTERASLPPSFAPSPLSEVVVLSDLWSPIAEVQRTIAQLSATGAHGHVVQIVDPAEETFPYSGRIEFIDPEGGGTRSRPAAPRPGATIIRRASSAIAPRSAPRPTGSAGASSSTAPTGRRANCCSRCTRAWAQARAAAASIAGTRRRNPRGAA